MSHLRTDKCLTLNWRKKPLGPQRWPFGVLSMSRVKTNYKIICIPTQFGDPKFTSWISKSWTGYRNRVLASKIIVIKTLTAHFSFHWWPPTWGLARSCRSRTSRVRTCLRGTVLSRLLCAKKGASASRLVVSWGAPLTHSRVGPLSSGSPVEVVSSVLCGVRPV